MLADECQPAWRVFQRPAIVGDRRSARDAVRGELPLAQLDQAITHPDRAGSRRLHRADRAGPQRTSISCCIASRFFGVGSGCSYASMRAMIRRDRDQIPARYSAASLHLARRYVPDPQVLRDLGQLAIECRVAGEAEDIACAVVVEPVECFAARLSRQASPRWHWPAWEAFHLHNVA